MRRAVLLLAAACAGPALAQEAAAPPPSPPVKMAVPGEPPPPPARGRFGATRATSLAIKNTTRDTLACRLAVGAAPARALTFRPGQQFSEDLRTLDDISLTCPQVRRAAYSPLLLGSRYVFLRLEGTPQLVEVAPPNPR